GNFAFQKDNQLPPQNLVPETKQTIELGTEIDLFDGRVKLDATWFKDKVEDQLVQVPVPQSTGFTISLVNLGETETTGTEISLSGDVVRTDGGLTWNTAFNYTQNEFKINELAPGVERVTIGNGFNSVSVVGEVGTGFQLRATDVLRDSISGRPIIDPNTGLRQPGDPTNFGDIMPDFTLGWVNSVSYKGVTLRWTMEWRNGGKIRSATVNDLRDAGAVTETLAGREGTLIDVAGVLENEDGSFRDNDVPVRSTRDFWTNLDNNNVSGNAVFDGTFIKLREVGLFYSLPSSIIGNTPFKRGVILGVEGRNLALLYSKVPHIDPETGSLLGAGSDAFGIERQSVPTTRSLGFNVKLNF
ncbi:MAG: TonB-dependent receptor, partial [Bacteroidota bacterium]